MQTPSTRWDRGQRADHWRYTTTANSSQERTMQRLDLQPLNLEHFGHPCPHCRRRCDRRNVLKSNPNASLVPNSLLDAITLCRADKGLTLGSSTPESSGHDVAGAVRESDPHRGLICPNPGSHTT